MFRRKDGKHPIYLFKDLRKARCFSFKTETAVRVEVSRDKGGKALTMKRYK